MTSPRLHTQTTKRKILLSVSRFSTNSFRRYTRRLAEFPDSGALILISPVYPDGSVAAYEELIGNHGGVGGDQTHAILIHPAEFKVDGDKIKNSEQIFPILNKARPET